MPFPSVPGWQTGQQPNQQATFEFFMSNFEQFNARFVEAKYPDLYWQEVIPSGSVDTGINPGAQSASYPTLDWRGKAGWRARYGKNVPTVSFVTGKNRVPIESGAISGLLDIEEIEQVQFGVQMDLRSRYPEVMRKACERHVEGTTFYGDASLNWYPYLDFPGVPTSTVAVGAGGATEWENKTPDEILADMNMALITPWVLTRQVHTPNVLAIPPAHWGYIATTPRSPNSDTTILSYFLQNNIVSNRNQMSGATDVAPNPVRVMALPYLDRAGTAGSARMMVWEDNADNFYMPFPRPFEMLAPQFVDYTIKLYARYRFGPVNFVYPKAFAYIDGI